ncbi:NAD(P)/FAD-dependent oxidoreductase [Blastococcus mobilis]|uniref:Thioredoxin reductase n=1 Tax=Blastococcus mobilis TaxID=1938746 RepID=A0A238Y5R2_9ACTN|nr:FAD/NAD(P)-binding oxidoreductase [Blastococcus mobilis]SNR65679.1 Thioredoxin reductase [Blastococcus mobilis]
MGTSRSDRVHDVVVVGAGPAGLAAAGRAAALGADVALVDGAAVPGGQYWRQPADDALAGSVASLHHGLARYRRLVERVRGIEAAGGWFPRHQVWTVTREEGTFVVLAITGTGAEEREVGIRGRRLVLAPGAYDRQVPFPGWDLPGVMTAGGVQALLKGHAVTAGRRVVVAGTGPFLLPVAAGLAESGATVAGVHEAASPLAWGRHIGAVVRNVAKLGEGAGYVRTLARHRVPVRTRSVVVAAHGEQVLERLTVARLAADGSVLPGSRTTVAADVLAVGWGFTPQLELPMALGCATRVDVDGSLVCTVDDQQRSSVEGVFVAGEACGIGGADLAVVEGEIAGAAAAGTPLTDRRLLRRRLALRRFAAAMHAAHPVPTGWIDRLTEDTVVCRCEEVTVGRLRSALPLGADDARSAKLLARPGMGWCQGRVCGYAVSCVMSAWTGVPPSPVSIAARSVASPLRLGTVAATEDPSSAAES